MDATQLIVPRVTRSGGVDPLLEAATPAFADASPFMDMLRTPLPPRATKSASDPPAASSEAPSSNSKAEPSVSDARPRASNSDARPPRSESTTESKSAQSEEEEEKRGEDDSDSNNDVAAEATAAAALGASPAATPEPAEKAALGSELPPIKQTEPLQTAIEETSLEQSLPAADASSASGDELKSEEEKAAEAKAQQALVGINNPDTATKSVEGAQVVTSDEAALPKGAQDDRTAKKKAASKPATLDKAVELAESDSQSLPPEVAASVATTVPPAAEPPVLEEKISDPKQTGQEIVADSRETSETKASFGDSLPSTTTAEAPPLPETPVAVATPAFSAPPPPDSATKSVDGAFNAPPQNSPDSRLPNWLRGPTETTPERKPIVVDATRFLQRVTRAFEAAQSRGGDVKLRLSPPELGAVQIELRVQDGVLSARLETENTAAKSVLLENLPALKERLAEQGMRIENFEVNVGSRGNGGTPDRPQDRPDEPRVPAPQSVRDADRRTSGAEQTARPRIWTGDGALNVIV